MQCRGKYITILDRDDYRIDKLKLQIKIDFLEVNPKYICVLTRLQFVNGYTKEI